MTAAGPPFRPPRPIPDAIRVRRATNGMWAVEVHYRGSVIVDVAGTRRHQGEALALAAFTAVVRHDDHLCALEREGYAIIAAEAWDRRWMDRP